MTPQPGDGKPVSRVDSFEIIDVDCDQICTNEEKTWPVAPVQVRIDSFEVSETTPVVEPDELVIRVTLPPDTAANDVSTVVQKVRAAVEDARTATGGRIPIEIHAPAT